MPSPSFAAERLPGAPRRRRAPAPRPGGRAFYRLEPRWRKPNRARYYQPGVGRFGGEDPLRFVGGSSFYSYARSAPVLAGDPLGLFDVVRDFLEPAAAFSAGMGDSLSFGLTTRFNEWTGASNAVDKCSGWYRGGELTGVGVGLAFGGAHVGRNAIYQMGKAPGLLRGISRLASDPRKWPSVRRMWSATAQGLKSKGQSLHHWAIPQRWTFVPSAIRNGGWNYLPIGSGLNSWMNGSTAARVALEWAFKGTVAGIYGSLESVVPNPACGCDE